MSAEQDMRQMRVRIFDELSKIVDPEINTSITDLELIDEVDIKVDNVKVDLHLTSPFCPTVFGFKICQDIHDNLLQIDGVNDVKVNVSNHIAAELINNQVNSSRNPKKDGSAGAPPPPGQPPPPAPTAAGAAARPAPAPAPTAAGAAARPAPAAGAARSRVPSAQQRGRRPRKDRVYSLLAQLIWKLPGLRSAFYRSPALETKHRVWPPGSATSITFSAVLPDSRQALS